MIVNPKQPTELDYSFLQCMANLCASPDVVKILEGKNDKFKYLFLCTSDEDVEIIKAACGALCMVMSVSPICLKKVFDVSIGSVLLLFFFVSSVIVLSFLLLDPLNNWSIVL